MFVFNSVLQSNTVDIKTGLPNPPHFSGISVSHSCLPPSYIFRIQGLSTVSTEYNSMFPCRKLPALSLKREGEEFSGEGIKFSAQAGGYYKKLRQEFGATGWRCKADLPGREHRGGRITSQGDRWKQLTWWEKQKRKDERWVWQQVRGAGCQEMDVKLGQCGRERGLKSFPCLSFWKDASCTCGHGALATLL